MLSRWLFNHIRNEDHGYVDTAKAYLRMAQQGGPAAEKERLKAELKRGAGAAPEEKGSLARLFGGRCVIENGSAVARRYFRRHHSRTTSTGTRDLPSTFKATIAQHEFMPRQREPPLR